MSQPSSPLPMTTPSLSPPPSDTNGPPPPPPALSSTPESPFGRLILSAPRPALTPAQREDLERRRRDTLDNLIREFDDRDRRQRRLRYDKERQLLRLDRVEQELTEKQKQKKAANEEKHDKPHKPHIKLIFASYIDNKSSKEIERLHARIMAVKTELESDRKVEFSRDMERDSRHSLLTLAQHFPCDWTVVNADPTIIPSMLSGLTTHLGESETVSRVVQHLACMYLNVAGNLSRLDLLAQCNSLMLEHGAINLLVTAMYDSSQSLQIQAFSLLLLFVLSSSLQCSDYIVNGGGINVICMAMANHPLSCLINLCGPGLLSRLCHHLPQYSAFIVQSDALTLTLKAMSCHSKDEGIHLHCLHCFHQLSAQSPETRLLMTESGCIEAIITTAYTFLQSSIIQLACITLLDSLCNESIESVRLVWKNSGIQMSVLCLMNHSNDSELLLTTVKFLQRMEWSRIECQQSLVPVNGVKTLIQCVTSHTVNQSLMVGVAHLLALVVEFVTIIPSPIITIKSFLTSLLDSLSQLIKSYPTAFGTETLYINVVTCLRYLSRPVEGKSLLMSVNVVNALVTALKLHSGSVQVATQATATLFNLTEHSAETVRAKMIGAILADYQGLQMLLSLMETHSPVKSVVDQCVACLYNLIKHSVTEQHKFIALDGISSLLTACKDHSQSELVQRYALSIFACLSCTLDEKELFLKLHGDSINLILIAMRNHPSSLSLQCQGLLTLRNLTNKFDCGTAKSSEIIDVSLVKLKTFNESVLVTQYVCELLWNLSLTDSANKRKLLQSEAIALVLTARRLHTQVFDVRHATQGLLDVLECSVVEEGGKPNDGDSAEQKQLEQPYHQPRMAAILSAAAAAPPANLAVPVAAQPIPVMPTVESVPHASVSLASPSPVPVPSPVPLASPLSLPVPRQSSAIAAPGGSPVIDPHTASLLSDIILTIGHMRSAQSNIPALVYCCDHLCTLSALNPQSHSLIAAHNGISAIMDALRDNPYQELIQIAGLNTLGRLSSRTELMQQVASQGGMIAALTALNPTPSSALVAENALCVLRYLLDDDTNTNIAVRLGVPSLVMRALDTHRNASSVLEQGLRALLMLVTHYQSSLASVIDSSAVNQLCQAANAAIYHQSLIDTVLKILAVLASREAELVPMESSEFLFTVLNAQRSHPFHPIIQSNAATLLRAVRAGVADVDESDSDSENDGEDDDDDEEEKGVTEFTSVPLHHGGPSIPVSDLRSPLSPVRDGVEGVDEHHSAAEADDSQHSSDVDRPDEKAENPEDTKIAVRSRDRASHDEMPVRDDDAVDAKSHNDEEQEEQRSVSRQAGARASTGPEDEVKEISPATNYHTPSNHSVHIANDDADSADRQCAHSPSRSLSIGSTPSAPQTLSPASLDAAELLSCESVP